MPGSEYGKSFYRDQADRSEASARVIVPVVVDALTPESVVDVGCGTGAWLKVFKEHGVRRVIGIDGGDVPAHELRLERAEFIHADLRAPFPVTGSFDLAVSLEVAEHLPESDADRFVEQLTKLAPAVLFSAAIPHQGGTSHVNERWPSYWSAKFLSRGYRLIDCVRPAVWSSSDVEIHYAQNTLLFVTDSIELAPELERFRDGPRVVDIVHPRLFEKNMRHPVLAWLAGRFPRLSIRVQRVLRLKR